MPDKNYYKNYYKRIPKTLKHYGYRLCKLKQEVAEMKHYWKIRCKERKTLIYRNKKLALLLSRMKNLEEALGNLMNRKHFTIRSCTAHKNKLSEQCYPLFISHNEYSRLKTLLKRRKVGRPKNRKEVKRC